MVSTDTVVLAEAERMLRDALTCIHAVMHASPTRTMIRPDSITVALDPPTIKRFTKRLRDPAPTSGAVREVLLEFWLSRTFGASQDLEDPGNSLARHVFLVSPRHLSRESR